MSQRIKRHYDAVAQLGCVACFKDGITNPGVHLHHIAGRKRGHEIEVIPLCPAHHMGGANEALPSVHGRKKEFKERYGTEAELLEVVERSVEAGHWVI
ncbi:MAG: Ref family recombination enhancement nuclease [Pseudomonadota bacterium]